jgi:UTP--glucose-1-phosphate uridylyltransferase
MPKITKAVIPAAGRGTRMKPLSNYLAKPMLPLGKKPVLQHIIEELKGAGITQIAIIIRSEHNSIVEYFSDVDGISFIYDDSFSGPGGAILKAESFVNRDNFVVIFSDAPIRGTYRSRYLRKLIDFKKEAEAVLAVYQIPQKEVPSRGIVNIEEKELAQSELVKLTDIIEKPSADQEVGRWASACRYVFSPNIFEALKEKDSDENRELQLTPAIQYLIRAGQLVVGCPLPGNLRRYDTGNFEGYFKAFRDFTEDSLA